MADYDSPWKEALDRYFEACLALFFPEAHADIDWTMFGDIASLGVTAGASAPEVLVEEVIAAFAERYDVRVETVTTAEESMFFPLPRVLRENEAAE